MIAPLIFAAALAASPPPISGCGATQDGRSGTCEVVPCNDTYKAFLGTWSGQFWAYVQKQSVNGRPLYRPYRDTVTYAAGDCL